MILFVLCLTGVAASAGPDALRSALQSPAGLSALFVENFGGEYTADQAKFRLRVFKLVYIYHGEGQREQAIGEGDKSDFRLTRWFPTSFSHLSTS